MPAYGRMSPKQLMDLHLEWRRNNPEVRQTWEYWDTKKNMPASVTSAISEFQAWWQIRMWQLRDEAAGNPGRSRYLVPRRMR